MKPNVIDERERQRVMKLYREFCERIDEPSLSTDPIRCPCW
jgi:hypothetical protein